MPLSVGPIAHRALCAGLALWSGLAPCAGPTLGASANAVLSAPVNSAPTDPAAGAATASADNGPDARTSSALHSPSNVVSSAPVRGIPEVLQLQDGVKDPVFAILVGLVQSDAYGTLTEDRVQSALQTCKAKSRLPYASLQDLTRTPVLLGHTALVTIHFNGDLDLPIPYSILGYHPGSFTATQTCIFREWNLGRVRMSDTEKVHGKWVPATIDLEDVHLFGLQQGTVVIKIDAFVDKLLGSLLDTTDVTALMLCRYHGDWLGFAMGYNDKHSGRSGAFRFARDEIIFPSPDAMKTVGRTMRAQAEALGAQWAMSGVNAGAN